MIPAGPGRITLRGQVRAPRTVYAERCARGRSRDVPHVETLTAPEGPGPGHRPGVTAGPARLHIYTAGDQSPTAAGEVCSGQGRVGRVEMANILPDKETFLGASLADTQRPLQGKHHFYDLIH